MSDRGLETNLETESGKPEFYYVVFVQLAFPSSTIRAHSSAGNTEWGGNTWYGVGTYGSIDPMEESLSLSDQPVKVVLSGVDTKLISELGSDDIYGRDADIYVGVLDPETRALLGTPFNWVSGFMDYSDVVVGNANAVVINIQTRASRLKRRNNKRYTIEDHQQNYSTDLFLEFLPYLQEAEVMWGGERVRTGFQNTGGFSQPSDPGRGTSGGLTRK